MKKLFVCFGQRIKNCKFKRIILSGLWLCLSPVLFAQITVKVKQQPIREILKTIEKASDYRFFYNTDLASLDREKSLTVADASIESVLEQLFSDTNIAYKQEKEHLIVLTLKEKAASVPDASKKITGKVLDEKGEPIVGANVLIKGTTEGVTTDGNGSFRLAASDQAVLSVSFIGYTPREIAVKRQSSIRVVLKEDAQLLDEVVVEVAYGKQKKVSVTGALASASGKRLAEVPTSSISNTLGGRLPGLISYTRSGEPGYDDAKLLIRGASTTGDSSPLIVVDGVADRAGGFSRIDANDIESVTILKDASAAIYGSRAANGVVLVTTKRGRTEKLTVTYNGNVGMSMPTKLPEMSESWQYAQMRNEIYTLVKGQNPEYTAEEIEKFRKGSDPLNYPNIDIFDFVLKPAVQTQQNVSVSGGSQLINYYGSIGYQYQDNYYKNSASNYNQYNLRSNIDLMPSRNARIRVNLAARQEDRNAPVYTSSDLWRFILNYDPRVNICWPGTDYPTTATKELYNPLTAVDETMGYTQDKSSYFNADLTLHLDLPWITEGLSFDGGAYFDRTDRFWKRFEKKFYLYAKEGEEYIARPYGPSNAKLNQNMSQTLGITFNARLNYTRTFHAVHYVNAFLAYEQYKSRYDYMEAYLQDFVSTTVDQLFAGDKTTATNSGTATETARQNYFGRVDYAYDNRYLVQFNWRLDGSENFPKGNRFGFFPGVSLGWRISEEAFWKEHVSFMDYLKIRGSWGQMGNDKVAAFQYMTTYTFSNPGVLGGSAQTGIWMNRNANPNITWEVATTSNIGMEARFLNDFNFEIDFFKTKRSNILAVRNAAIPDYAGLHLPDENIGECSSQGTEIVLNYTKKIGDFRLNVGGNFTYADNKINFIDEPATTLEWQKRTGKSIGVTDDYRYLMYEADGIFHTQEELDAYPHLANTTVGDLKFVDVNKDGVIDANDKVRQDKPSIPKIMYGLNLGMDYKDWSLNLLFQGAAQVWQYTFMDAGLVGNFPKDFYENRWTPEHIDGTYPKVYNRDESPAGGGSYRNTFWLNNSSYLRLKNIVVSYSLPASLLKKTPLSAVRLSLSGYNLLTFTGVRNNDPEITDSDQGYVAWETPQSKVVNFGINVTF